MKDIYDFDWLVDDIYNSIGFILNDGSKQLGKYRISELKTNGVNGIGVKTANINDLINFINHTMVRFTDMKDETNVFDVPLINLYRLYEDTDGKPHKFTLDVLGAFGVHDSHVLGDGHNIYVDKAGEASKDLKEIMFLAHNFAKLDMNEIIATLVRIDEINMRRMKKGKSK